MSDEARQCPITPQELRFMADEIERRCDEALTQSAARGPCLICRKDAKRVRAVADWLDEQADSGEIKTEYLEPTFPAGPTEAA